MQKLSMLARVVMGLVSLAVIAALFTPLWRIDLVAPQYPEGLTMKIWHDHLTGDVDIINGLNHYIGMRKIHVEQFPEFGFLRFVIYGFVALGLLVALIGRRFMLWLYVAASAVAGCLGLWDFYQWMYQYGHNLDSTAPIEFPEGGFQPPLLGFKQVLNFEIWSLPDMGGWLIVGAGVVAALLLGWELFLRKTRPSSALAVAAALASTSFLASCSAQPQPFAYGKDACDYCRMVIADQKFGGEVLLKTGKAYKFDDLNCMAWWLQQNPDEAPKIAQRLVIAFDRPTQLIAAETAFFVENEALKSPMRADVAAFSKKEAVSEGQALDWPGVLSAFKK